MSVNYREMKDTLKLTSDIPEWYSTNALQFFMDSYSYNKEGVKQRYQMIAKTLAKFAPDVFPTWWVGNEYTKGLSYEEGFFKALWDGYAIPSSPVMSNTGLPERGLTVSCCGQHMSNSIAGKAFSRGELEVLIKNSHGCSMSVTDWLAEGDAYGDDDNISAGVIPVIDDMQNSTEDTNQSKRRGQTVFSLDVLHGDFWRVVRKLDAERAFLNISWLMTDKFISLLENGDEEAISRWNEICYVKQKTGKGYFTKIDTMNRNKAEVFKALGLDVKGSNLCNEVNLPANHEYSFTCVIMNINLTLYDTMPSNMFKIVHLMQDCNVSNYIQDIEKKTGDNAVFLSKVLKFTKDFRAVGTGVAGLHSLFMQRGYVFGGFDSMLLNEEIFKRMRKDTREVSQWLGDVLGVPEGIKKAGFTYRNATTMMMPPTKSSSETARNSPTEGINPETALVKVKESVAGELYRINTALLKIMKERGVYNTQTINDIHHHKGSVQHVTWLTEDEKPVFRTAFEIPMEDHLSLCSQRQVYIDQQQSINLFFSGSDSEEYIAKVQKIALLDEMCNGTYYNYSSRGGVFVRPESCAICQ